MKKHYLFLMLLLPFMGKAQSCFQPFKADCWFQSTFVVRISDDGSRFMVVGGNGPSGNTETTSCAVTNTMTKIYNVSPSGITYNSGQSQTVYQVSDFTANMGYFYLSSSVLYFEDSAGTSRDLGAGTLTYPDPIIRAYGHPNMYSVRHGNGEMVIADASVPSAPTATKVTLPSGGNQSNLGIVDYKAKRIYYATTEGETSTTQAPYYRYKIKCCDLGGKAVSGWTDVVIQRGKPETIRIRPTDGRIFVRVDHTDHHYPFHGIVVFNPDGTVPQDMNFTDLSIMGGPYTQNVLKDLAFDANGNIYANVYAFRSGGSTNAIPTSMMKFDPQGNLDMGFLRSQWNSYGVAVGGGASTFDISDGGIIIKNTAGTTDAAEDQYALDINHINANNEDPEHTYSFLKHSLNTWGTYPLFRNGPTSNYLDVQFLFNNGRLVLPGMSAGSIAANCGIATPQTVPPANDPATGVINCPKTAFISAPVAGTSSNIVIRVEINVTKLGTFSPITVKGSGFSLIDPNFTIQATELGVHTFDVPVHYDGSTLGTLDINAGQAGSCMADLSNMNNKKRVEVEIWTPENCTFKQVGPTLK